MTELKSKQKYTDFKISTLIFFVLPYFASIEQKKVNRKFLQKISPLISNKKVKIQDVYKSKFS